MLALEVAPIFKQLRGRAISKLVPRNVLPEGMIATLEMWVLTIEVLGEEAKAIRKTSLEAGVSEDHLEVDGAEDQQDKRSRRSHLRLPR